MFAPDIWPAYYSKAKGARVWDLDGREFLDMSIMGIGANVLGYADEDVDNAVIEAITRGSSCSLNSLYEIELATLLLELHPWFDMVRYSRSGGEAMSIAVRIARAKTNRDLILFSGYHGWNDWYLAANLANDSNLDGQLMPGLSPNGVPRGLSGTAIPFEANSIDSIKDKIRGKENEVAAIVIEPARGEAAEPRYLQALKDLAEEIGAVLIFDEITSGFRQCVGGLHILSKVAPDIAVFAKSIANGYPIGVVMGREGVMQAAQNTFISSTNWTEAVGPAAAIETIKKFKKERVDTHLVKIGTAVQNVLKDSSKRHGVDITVSGIPSLTAFQFNVPNANLLNTYFTVSCLEYGVLGFRQFKASYSHQENDVSMYSKVVDAIFRDISNDATRIELSTPLHHNGFKRLTRE